MGVIQGLKAKLTDPEERGELLRYLIVGVLTTGVDLLVFSLLTHFFGVEHKQVWNSAAWMAAILFSFVMSRDFVFRSDNPLWPEFLRHVSSRVLISLIFSNGGLWLFYDVLGIRQRFFGTSLLWAKVLVLFFVVVGNYIVGKIFVFQKQKS